MNHLHIATDTFLPRHDGVSIFLQRSLPHLCTAYEVSISAPAFGILPEGLCADVDLHPLGRRVADIRIAKLTRQGRKRLHQHIQASDLIFTQTIGPLGATALRLAKRLRKPRAAYIHSREWELFSRSIKAPDLVKSMVERGTLAYMRRVYTQARLLITPTEEVGMLLKSYGISTPSTTVPLGVNTLHFTPPLNPSRAKKAYGFTLKQVVLGYVGRLALEKDPYTLIRAYTYLRKKYPQLRLLLVGPGREDIIQKVKQMRDVTYAGELDDPLPAYQAMDVFILPSLTETTGLALLEAMSTALPVVTTRVGVAPELIKHGENGYFFPRRDWLRLARTLEPLIQDALLRQRIGSAARRTVQQQREEKIMLRKLLDALKLAEDMGG